MKNSVFWDVTPCGDCKNLLNRVTRRNIPEDGILQVLNCFVCPFCDLSLSYQKVVVRHVFEGLSLKHLMACQIEMQPHCLLSLAEVSTLCLATLSFV
jgi:hypothetical protein